MKLEWHQLNKCCECLVDLLCIEHMIAIEYQGSRRRKSVKCM